MLKHVLKLETLFWKLHIFNHKLSNHIFQVLKCYSQILCGGSAENFRFCLVCVDLVANWSKIFNQSYKDLFTWTELPIVWLIIGSNNIFKHIRQWSISNTNNCAELTNANSEWAKILDLRLLHGYLLIDDTERWC